ncbi:MAG TPA: hypothetical protein VGR26_08080, partial [Acidimicrobiales bacterium]|nr:hypothetical protein [Acidimicrobiales bacterium]
MLLALAPISGAAAATVDAAAATEAAAAQEESTEQSTDGAGATEAPEQLPVEVTEEPAPEPAPEPKPEPEPEPAPEPAPKQDKAPADEEADAPVTTTAVVEEEAKAETAAELEAAATGEVTTSAIDFGGITVYGDPDARRCNLIDFRYTDGHRDYFWFCGQQGDITQSMIPAMHVKELHISCSYVYGDGIIPKDPSHMIASWSIVKYESGEVWKTCGEVFAAPEVDIQKWIDTDKETQTINAGQNAVWTIKVTNTGGITLTDLAVTDAKASDCAKPSLAASLAPGQSVTYTCTSRDVTEGFTNLARVTTAQDVSDEDTAAVAVRTPDISITKEKDQEVAYGGTATWTITVKNTGEIPLTNVVVSDEKAPDCDKAIGNMAVGAVVEYECSLANVTAGFTNVAVVDSTEVGPKQDDAVVTVPGPTLDASWTCPTPGEGSIIVGTTNRPLSSVTLTFARDGGTQTFTTTQTGNFSFKGTGDNAGKVISSASIVSSVTSLSTTVKPTQAQMEACFDDKPAIEIIKSPVGWDGTLPETQQVTSGEAANWSITVKNTGDVPLTNVRVTDPLASDCELTGAEAFSLAVGASRTYVCDQPNVTAGFTNVATATGTPPIGKDVTDSDTSPVTVFTPALTAAWGCPTPGQGSVISGTTNVPLSSVTLTFARNGGTQTITTTQTGAFSFAGTGVNAGKVISGAQVVSSVSSLTTTVTPTSAQIDACYNGPAISIDKRPVGWNGVGTETQEVVSGQAATWTITVTNTGDVALTNVRVTDPLASECDLTGAEAFSLGIGGSRVYTCSRPNVTAGFTNVATATGTPPTGGDVSDSDDSPVTVTAAPAPAIAIVKAYTLTPLVDEQTVDQGGTATWMIQVTNTGNTVLNNVTVTDALAPDCNRSL